MGSSRDEWRQGPELLRGRHYTRLLFEGGRVRVPVSYQGIALAMP